MGCDIHLHIEVKIEGIWHHYAAPNIARSYRLFSKMAGVRRREDAESPISAPKGLPSGLSTITKISRERWSVDGHTDSWLGPKEIEILSAWLIKQLGWPNSDLEHGVLHTYLFGHAWELNSDYMPEIEDFRFVFWFDN